MSAIKNRTVSVVSFKRERDGLLERGVIVGLGDDDGLIVDADCKPVASVWTWDFETAGGCFMASLGTFGGKRRL